MPPSLNYKSNRGKAFYGLAVAGFIALVGAGMWLAVYMSRFIPSVVNGTGAAAVYLGSSFLEALIPEKTATSAPSYIYFGDGITIPETETITIPEEKKEIPRIAGERINEQYILPSSANNFTATGGLPDFATKIIAAGYLSATSTDSFVSTTTIPFGRRPAVQFSIKNVGDAPTGTWHFSASIPTTTDYNFQSPLQQSLNPGDSIEYTLGFDQASAGTGKKISITANSDKTVKESNTANNASSVQVTILGS